MRIVKELMEIWPNEVCDRKRKKIGGKLELMEKFLRTRNLERGAML